MGIKKSGRERDILLSSKARNEVSVNLKRGEMYYGVQGNLYM